MFSLPAKSEIDGVVIPYIKSLRELVLHLVPICRPSLVLCGEARVEGPPSQARLQSSVLRREITAIDFVNVFGAAYLETYGRDFFLDAPGRLKEELPGGSILYQVTDGFFPWEASAPSPDEMERYFRAHRLARKAVYRPWLRKALLSANGWAALGTEGLPNDHRVNRARVSKSEEKLPHATPEGLRRLADFAAADAKARLGIDLDFSPASVAKLDVVLSTLFPPGQPHVSATLSSFGAYLGETVIRNLGGHWRASTDWRDCAVCDVGPVAEAFPGRRVEKCVSEGEGASLAAWYASVERRVRDGGGKGS